MIDFSVELGHFGDLIRQLSMHISITEAKSRLNELVRRAEAGETIILTRRGKPAVRLVPVSKAAEQE